MGFIDQVLTGFNRAVDKLDGALSQDQEAPNANINYLKITSYT